MAQDLIAQFNRAFQLPLETNRFVSTTTARDAISSTVRYQGMVVFVQADSQTYVLIGGITNSDWEIYGHADGVTNTFTTSDSKTVTVTNGIITSIV